MIGASSGLSPAVILGVAILAACAAPPGNGGTSSDTSGTSGATTIEPPEPIRILEFTEAATPDRAHQRTFGYALDTPAPALLECTTPSDPMERHVHAFPEGLQGSHTLFGLLAQTEHSCTLTAGDDVADVSFTTGDPLPSLQRWQIEGDPDAVWGAYTLVNQFRIGAIDQVVTVFDPQGRVRWTHAMGETTSTGLEARHLGDGRVLLGGATDHPPALVDLDGTVQWQVPENPDGHRYHHDAIITPQDTLLVLRADTATDGISDWTGFAIEEWSLPPTDLLWTWPVQQAIDAGTLPTGSGDVYHANALLWIDDALGSGPIVSMSHLDQLARIDKATGDVLWTLGHAGSIVPDQPFYGQHAPELDGNRLLLHDNGRFRPDGNWSRVLELDLDQMAGTAQMTDEWRQDGWWEKLWGDTDRLPDGTIQVARGHCSNCGVPESRTSIDVIDPANATPLWSLWIDDPDIGAYRAHRIDGCALFENERYCL